MSSLNANKYFTIHFEGKTSQPMFDDQPDGPTYESSANRVVYALTLEEAMMMVDERARKGNYVFLLPTDYDDDGCCDGENYDENDTFRPTIVSILNGQKELVVGGIFHRDLTHKFVFEWVKPIYDSEQINKTKIQINSMLEEASYEGGCDNHNTARNIREKAKKISLALAAEKYKNLLAETLWYLANVNRGLV